MWANQEQSPLPYLSSLRILDQGTVTQSAEVRIEKPNELMSQPHMKITDTRGAGAARPPRHHLFPQDNWEWFNAHEITIDRYTIEMNEGEHSAIHTMGWNRKVQDFIDQEGLYGERYTRWDIFRFMNLKRREFRLKGRLVVPYED
jgi:hypothetical protein